MLSVLFLALAFTAAFVAAFTWIADRWGPLEAVVAFVVAAVVWAAVSDLGDWWREGRP